MEGPVDLADLPIFVGVLSHGGMPEGRGRRKITKDRHDSLNCFELRCGYKPVMTACRRVEVVCGWG